MCMHVLDLINIFIKLSDTFEIKYHVIMIWNMILRLSDIFALDLSPLVFALSDDRVSNCQEKYMYKLDSFIDLLFKINAFFH